MSPAPSTALLIAALERVARYLENDAAHTPDAQERTALTARATICRQAAGRLEQLTAASGFSN